MLVFLRKQGRYYAVHHSIEETQRTIEWVGQIYVMRIVHQIPKNIARDVITLMEAAEEKQKHMNKLVDTARNGHPRTRTQFNLTPETVTFSGTTEIKGFY